MHIRGALSLLSDFVPVISLTLLTFNIAVSSVFWYKHSHEALWFVLPDAYSIGGKRERFFKVRGNRHTRNLSLNIMYIYGEAFFILYKK